MALKPTIYKARISLSDLNRDYYDCLNFTIARHPSETIERMMVRVLSYCINADEHLTFTKGLSAAEEPDLWSHTLDGQISLWIDVGEPAFERVKKASRISTTVRLYSFNLKSDIWWQQNCQQFNKLSISVYQFQWHEIQNLSQFAQRNIDISITISENSAYITGKSGDCEVTWLALQE